MSTRHRMVPAVLFGAILGAALLFARIGPVTAAAPKTYKTLRLTLASTPEKVEREINRVAAEGWELLEMVAVPGGSDALAVFEK